MLLSWLQLRAFNLEPRRLQHQKVSEPCPLLGLEARIQKLEHHEERRHFRPALGFLKGKWLSQSPVALAGRVLLSPPAARCRRDVPRAAREAAALAQEQVPLPSCNKNNNKKKKAERKAKSVSQLPGAAAARGLSLSPPLLLAREVSPSPAAGGTVPGK